MYLADRIFWPLLKIIAIILIEIENNTIFFPFNNFNKEKLFSILLKNPSLLKLSNIACNDVVNINDTTE